MGVGFDGEVSEPLIFDFGRYDGSVGVVERLHVRSVLFVADG